MSLSNQLWPKEWERACDSSHRNSILFVLKRRAKSGIQRELSLQQNARPLSHWSEKQAFAEGRSKGTRRQFQDLTPKW
jgi:hypothetical protein